MDKKDLKKQLIILSIILVIVIGVAIFVNVALNDKEQNINTNTVTDLNGKQTSIEDVKINGYTKEQIENMKPLLNTDAYQKYMETFNAIENGSIPYQEDFKLDIEEQKEVPNNTIDDTTSSINEADQNGDFSYLTINGVQTDIKVYDNVEGD